MVSPGKGAPPPMLLYKPHSRFHFMGLPLVFSFTPTFHWYHSDSIHKVSLNCLKSLWNGAGCRQVDQQISKYFVKKLHGIRPYLLVYEM